MNHFRFESPHWSATLWIALPVFAVLAWLLYRRSTVLTRLVSTLMQKRLIRQPSLLRRIVVLALYAAATVCFVIALMRPQFGLRYVSSPKVGAQLMFCLDVSKSMLAEDAAPNRLDRAKADITELLSYLDGDQVGLIAFAGRASVLCPMTTDYGFFRLILDGASPNSVGRGGTSLEEPLRKAIEGYREGGDVSRMVVLITDGEDHDSRPMDAAEEARKRGIRIIAVGLGDETGSEIRLTDPQTGGIKTLLDQDGNPVVSRLDGETLRELALATEGVYIPAGTGRLDLKSIYEAHLQPLVRDEFENERRAVRQEAFQWAILAGLILTAIAIFLGSRPATVRGEGAFGESGPNQTVSAATLVMIVALASPSIAIAETHDVRDQYNRGLKLLGSSSKQRLDDAEQYFTSARDQADNDGELRFRSTYNLGWVSVQRADLLINAPSQQANESLTQALKQLQQAADWFRDAVRLRPESDDARHNLEIVLKRIIQLRDQINRNEAGDVMQQLQALIESQRTRLQSLRGLVQQINRSDDPNIVDEYRNQFNRAAVDHRVALSDLEGLVEAVADEIDTIAGKDDSEKTAEDSVRELQLQSAAEHLATAGQRLGATRSQLRRRQAMRAFRRASASLDELKRAREQLLDPLQMLDGLLSDASPHLRDTILIASKASTTFAPSEEAAASDPVPAWIDQESLQETQINLSTRTNELIFRLTAGLEAADNQEQTDPSEDPQAAQQQAKLLRQIRLALPSLENALDQMRHSETELATPNYIHSIDHQVASIKSLRQAREQFADLRALIELAANDQQQIAEASSAWLESTESNDNADAAPQDPAQFDPTDAQALIARQQLNLQRAERIAGLIDEQLQQLDTASEADPSPEQGTGQNSDQEKQRYRLANQLASKAIEQMKTTDQSLAEAAKPGVDEASAKDAPDESKDEVERPKTDDTESENTETETEDAAPSNRQVNHAAQAAQHAEDAHQSLQQLRQLFFSLIEHLQETARRQSELNDQTQLAVGLQSQADADKELSEQARLAKLAQEQAELAEVATQLANAFEEQSQQSPPPEAPEQQQQAMQEAAQKSLRASELIGEGSELMNEAREHLASEAEERPDPTEAQTKALQKLLEALQELQPPPDQSQQQQNQPQQDQQQDQDQQQQEQQQQQQQAQPQLDPSRILQAVRDREAQRRREREMNLGTRQAPVTKDW